MVNKLVALSAIFVGVPLLTACSMNSAIAFQGFDFDAPDLGVYVASETFVTDCGGWAKMDVVDGDYEGVESIYYCAEEDAPNLFMYKGVYSPDLETLTSSSYYTSHGEDKSEVFIHEVDREVGVSPAYVNDGGYGGVLYLDPLLGLEENVENPEGTLATRDDIESSNWEEDGEFLTNEVGHALLAGVLYASLKDAKNSSQYKNDDMSFIAVPKKIKEDKSQVGYSSGVYFTSKGNITSNSHLVSDKTLSIDKGKVKDVKVASGKAVGSYTKVGGGGRGIS